MTPTTKHAAPRLRFAREFTEQDALEVQARGYLSHVLVEVDEGKLYPVFFYDPTRLQQDLTEGVRCGRPFVADPGMIVVAEVTPALMRDAVERLAGEGFFDRLVPVSEDELIGSDPYSWPPVASRPRSPVARG